jgi:hypothetical protein
MRSSGMTANGTTSSTVRSACPVCLRRSWLLAAMSCCLEEYAGDRARLLELLALEDRELIEAIAGNRRGELRARYARFHPSKNPVAREAWRASAATTATTRARWRTTRRRGCCA